MKLAYAGLRRRLSAIHAWLVRGAPLLGLMIGLFATSPTIANSLTEEQVEIKLEERSIRAAGIETARVDREAGTTEIVLPGVIAVPPHQMRVVSAPAAGLIESLLVAPDEQVRLGDPIAQIRSNDLVEAQRAFLAAASEDVLIAEKLRRDEQLFKEKIIAERRLLVTRAEAAKARAALDEQMQLLSLAGMSENEIHALRVTRKIAPSLTIFAPMTGTILSRQATAGERIQEASPLVTIGQLRPLWVNIQTPLSRVAALQPNMRVMLPSLGAEGRLIRIGRSVDQQTQSVTVVAEVSANNMLLRPGQAVSAVVQLYQNGAPQWRVPGAAVIRHSDRSWVFVRSASGFQARSVQVLSETPQYASVLAKLSSEDQVAVRGVITLLSELIEASSH